MVPAIHLFDAQALQKRSYGLPVVLGCLLYVTMALFGVAHDSGTYDEFVHVTAGYSYWAFNDYRLNPENGNLSQRIVALPLLLGAEPGGTFPSRDQPAWHGSNMWTLSEQLFFAPGRNADALLFRARIMVAIVGALLGVLVFFWSRALFGTWGAYVSFTLYVFSPTMLANGGLATSDVIGAAFFVGALWALWVVLHRVTPLTLTTSLAAVGGLFLAKSSAPLIVPIGLLMIGVQLIGKRPIVVRWREERVLESRVARAGATVLLVLVHVVAAWVLIWAAYGFRYSAFASGSPAGDTFLEQWSSVFEHGSGMATSLAQWARTHHVLPEAYLYGFAVVVEYAKMRSGFLNGHISLSGTRTFFAFTTLYKSTVPSLILAACAAGVILIGWRRRRSSVDTAYVWTLPIYELAPLLLGIAIYGASAMFTALNIGHRHLLPIIPLAIILTGAVGPATAGAWREAWPWRRDNFLRHGRPLAAAGIALLLAWHAAESITIAPHYLAYFNQLAGGPSQGYRHLVDSSLDWGRTCRDSRRGSIAKDSRARITGRCICRTSAPRSRATTASTRHCFRAIPTARRRVSPDLSSPESIVLARRCCKASTSCGRDCGISNTRTSIARRSSSCSRSTAPLRIQARDRRLSARRASHSGSTTFTSTNTCGPLDWPPICGVVNRISRSGIRF